MLALARARLFSAPAPRLLAQRSAAAARRWEHRPARSDRYKVLSSANVERLRELVPEETVLATTAVGGTADAAELEGFNADWLNKYRGSSQLVLKPKTTKEVSEILR
ncbi:D-lactate ferricytochrome c oxidoreductase, partial [Coemansia biformis]